MLSSRLFKSAALGLALMIAGCSRESSDPAQPAASGTAAGDPAQGMLDRSHKGSEMPDLAFKDAAGKQLELKALRGKPVLVNLWATWCAPCIAEMPALDKLAASEGEKLRVLTVSQDLRQPEKVTAFFREKQLGKLEPWLDPDNLLSDHYQAQVLPTTVYYDAGGREVWRFTGPREWGDAETAKLLAEAE